MTNDDRNRNCECRNGSAGTHSCNHSPSFSFPRPVIRISSLLLTGLVLAINLLARDPIDENKLPPAASSKVDFEQVIKPIFEARCYRCHGSEKPKSHFRLDSRE